MFNTKPCAVFVEYVNYKLTIHNNFMTLRQLFPCLDYGLDYRGTGIRFLDDTRDFFFFCILQGTQIGSGTLPTQLLMLWVPRIYVLLGQRGRSIELPNYLYIGRNVEVETARIYTYNPLYAFVVRCLINPKDKFNFITRFVNISVSAFVASFSIHRF